MRHRGKTLTSSASDLSVYTVRGRDRRGPSESPSEALQSFPVSVAATIGALTLQTKAASNC